ncbi:unnamed protein product [Polarella glacialis]|uniref:Uncharacterized protein n=1 Tax=Polarella glacialis TaxID=89957 RepID=A0A813ENP4_POLGL|nr:unnamed protein product [Polarella glacialis]|mmetsp:Transcript_33950/g.61080  ORF Transcript_33950/g.61080 Transcript_33950/m.61080 type:complete len:302 (-) Transcript_33950:65-970(-)
MAARSNSNMGDVDQETLKRLKREAAIRAKEEDFERRNKAEEKKKKAHLKSLRDEYDNRMAKRESDRLGGLKRQTEIRARKKAENDRLDKRRNQKIAAKLKAWKDRANTEIQAVIEDQVAEEERLEEAINDARRRKHEKEEEIRAQINELKGRQEELEMNRNEANAERQRKRDLRAITRVDHLKIEAHAELESFIQNPFPVPLKQVLAGRLRPVPKVSELLAAYKDQREDLQQLEAQDIPLRAQLCNQTIFQYVRDIQLKAESERMRPPEPVAGDLMRAMGKKQKAPSSPQGRKTLKSRAGK